MFFNKVSELFVVVCRTVAHCRMQSPNVALCRQLSLVVVVATVKLSPCAKNRGI